MTVDLDEEVDDEGRPPPPPRLAAAAEEMLGLASEAARSLHPEVSDVQRLLEVLRLVGRLHGLCTAHVSVFDDPTARDEEERAWAAERELAFIRRCADELTELATGCVAFAVALLIDLRPDWEDPPESRQTALAEAREEILTELGILGQRQRGPRLAATKHEVAEFLRPTLLFAALQCADAAHEMTDQQFPGTAAGTMLGLAASVLTDGEQIALAASYRSWPEMEDDW